MHTCTIITAAAWLLIVAVGMAAAGSWYNVQVRESFAVCGELTSAHSVT
jgi:hypothetical protein